MHRVVVFTSMLVGVCTVLKKKLRRLYATSPHRCAEGFAGGRGPFFKKTPNPPHVASASRLSQQQMTPLPKQAIPLNKKLHHVYVPQLSRQVEGRVAVVILRVGVCAVLKQKLHNLQIPPLRRRVKRRPPLGITCIGIRPVSKKYIRHISPATESRQMEGGIAVFVLRAGVCAVLKQKLHNLQIPPLRGEVEGGAAEDVAAVGVRPLLEELGG
jgi:hypothetical protein